MTLPILYHKGKGGAMYQWRVWTDGAKVLTEYGQVGGALQTTVGRVCTPKNEGKKNATTAESQAEAEAQSLWTNKVERKYREDPSAAEEPLQLPMLATDIEKVKGINFIGHCQPKSDGARALARLVDGRVQLMSRSGKPYSVPHVESALLKVLDDQTVLDGELYCHGLSCQTIISLIKRQQPESVKIGYHVYDIPVYRGSEDALSIERMQWLADGPLNNAAAPIFRVPTHEVAAKERCYELQREFIEQGYEGAMLRLPDARYEWGYRSKALLKIKSFDDSEVTVIGAREGLGKMAGCVIWLCRAANGKEFECTPACPMEERARQWQERDQYIGRKLTIKHFGTSDDGVPRFPVGKLFRPAEDLPT